MARREDGFTIVELMVVVSIIGVLTAVAVASFTMNTTRSEKVTCQSNQRILTQAITTYQVVHQGTMPDELDDLQPYTRAFARATRCPSDGKPLVYDQAGATVTCTYPGHSD